MSYVQEPGGDATNGEETLTQHSWFMGRKEKKNQDTRYLPRA